MKSDDYLGLGVAVGVIGAVSVVRSDGRSWLLLVGLVAELASCALILVGLLDNNVSGEHRARYGRGRTSAQVARTRAVNAARSRVTRPDPAGIRRGRDQPPIRQKGCPTGSAVSSGARNTSGVEGFGQ